ncbi:MAG: response regulator [Clostridia bacterium]|nr:response regulator [Clostridia bacterium]
MANMSHEIRTPLNTIKGLNEVILRDYKEPQLQDYANNIQNSTATLMTLINDILDFSKIEAGKIIIQEQAYQTNAFFQSVITEFKPKVQAKGLTFEIEISHELPEFYYGDEIRIRQILINLLSNAIKYTSEGSVSLMARRMIIDEGKDQLIISVKDTGIGIEEADIPRLFKSFERVEEARNRSIEGIGLGLNIVKQLTEQMGGELKVFSVYESGSIFTVIIPQKKQAVLIRKSIASDTNEDHFFVASRAKLLVVDDSKTNLMVVAALLKNTNMQITMVTSGEECLEEITKQHFDLIFLDHRMPLMDGIETLNEIRKREHLCKDTPIVMLTANAVNDAKADYLKAGFDDFLSKPINLEEMYIIIRKLLAPELID